MNCLHLPQGLITPGPLFVTATTHNISSFLPSSSGSPRSALVRPGVLRDEQPFAAALEKATFSAQREPEKWKVFIPVKVRAWEVRQAEETVSVTS
jgi:hypothetical protein